MYCTSCNRLCRVGRSVGCMNYIPQATAYILPTVHDYDRVLCPVRTNMYTA